MGKKMEEEIVGKYNLYIEGMRFVFTLYIILMHGEYLFRDITYIRVFEGGYLGVDFFFIVSGFYMAQKVEDNVKVRDYFKVRLSKLYPHYFVSLLTAWIIFPGNGFLIKLRDLFWSVFMVQNLGLNINLYNGVLWYVTYLFYAGIPIYILLRKLEVKRVAILSMLYIFLFYFTIFKFYGTIDNVSQTNIVLPSGFYRAIADLLCGVLIYKVVQLYKKSEPKNARGGKRWLLIFLTCGSLLISFYKPHTYFDILVIMCFVMCVYLSNTLESTSRSTLLAKLIVNIGRRCYCVYCYQIIAFEIVEKYFPINNVLWVLFACVAVALFFDRIVSVMQKSIM